MPQPQSAWSSEVRDARRVHARRSPTLNRNFTLGFLLGAAVALAVGMVVVNQREQAAGSGTLDDYERHEVTHGLHRIAFAAAQHYLREGSFPPESVGPTPALGTCCNDDSDCRPPDESWADPRWKALGFEAIADQPYSYQYVFGGSPHGGPFIVRARKTCDADAPALELYGGLDGEGRLFVQPFAVAAPR